MLYVFCYFNSGKFKASRVVFWESFENIVKKAKIACINAETEVTDHFADVGKMVGLGSDGQ